MNLKGKIIIRDRDFYECKICGFEIDWFDTQLHLRKDGWHPTYVCQECYKTTPAYLKHLENMRKYIEKNKEHVYALNKKYQKKHKSRLKVYYINLRQDPEFKAKMAAYQRERRKVPEIRFKDLARHKLGYHVRTGNLKKLPCEVCGIKKVQAHHEDYNKPLDVKWLCIRHHSQLHVDKSLVLKI